MSLNEEEMVKEMPVVNLSLDEAVKILAQLKAFDIALYKDVIHLNPEKDDIPLGLKANLGMVVLNNRIGKNIYNRIEDIIEESSYYKSLLLLDMQSKMFEAVVDGMYQEAKEQFKNEE